MADESKFEYRSSLGEEEIAADHAQFIWIVGVGETYCDDEQESRWAFSEQQKAEDFAAAWMVKHGYENYRWPGCLIKQGDEYPSDQWLFIYKIPLNGKLLP